MSANTLMIRDLAQAAASHPRIESAVQNALKNELPGVIEEILSAQYGGAKIYVAKTSNRRLRDEAIRAKFNGRNAQALSHEFKLSIRQVMRICGYK